MPIRVLELHHHAVRVPPEPAAAAAVRDFYMQVLGLMPDPGRPQLSLQGSWLDVGMTAQLHLMAVAGLGRDLGQGLDSTEPHVAFAVESIAEARAELARLGVPHAVSARSAEPDAARVFLRDPAGNLVELHQIGRCRCAPNARGAAASGYVRAEGVVMFADMRGFTPLCERREPAAVAELLNEYFALLTGIAISHGGRTFTPAGDCLITGFGIPDSAPDAPRAAVEAAREMLLRYAELADDWRARHGIETGLGIGLNRGVVIAGRIGVPGHDTYTIIGDTVNVAARLSQRARAGEALIAQAVLAALPGGAEAIGARDLPPIELRGRAEPIEIACLPAPHRMDLRPRAAAT